MATSDSTHDAGRRAFLRGKAHAVPVLRPPWAIEESLFLETCTSCRVCIERCPEHVLVPGPGGYPQFDPRQGECTFCGECAVACPSKALDRIATQPPWQWKSHVDTADCLACHSIVCTSCLDACPEHAMVFDPPVGSVRTPVVQADRCTGCGACVATCPVDAVSLRIPQSRA